MSWFDDVLTDCVNVDPDLRRMRSTVPKVKGLALVATVYSDTIEHLWDEMEGFGGEGWVTTLDNFHENWNGERTSDRPLHAELVNKATTLTVRYAEARWRVDRIQEVEDSDQRIFTEQYARRPVGTLHYDVAWKVVNGRWQPWLSRLREIETTRQGSI